MSRINKSWVDATILSEDSKGVANGVATLDGSAKIPASQLPISAMEYKGAWNVATNTPTLIDGNGTSGDTYRVSVGGTRDLGGGSVVYAIGDLVIYSGTVWELAPADSSFTGKDTDDLVEGSSNLYFVESRVEDTTLANYVVGANTALANTDDVKGAFGKVQGQINALSGSAITFGEEVISLVALDITNGYVDLAQAPLASSVTVFPDNGPVQKFGEDYTISTNRVTFAGDLATTLVAGVDLIVKYAY